MTMEGLKGFLKQTLSEKIDALQQAVESVGNDLQVFKNTVTQDLGVMKIRTKDLETNVDSLKGKSVQSRSRSRSSTIKVQPQVMRQWKGGCRRSKLAWLACISQPHQSPMQQR